MVKFAFIGCGKISRFHADAVVALQQSICGVSARPGSKNIADFSRQFNILNSYDNWRQMVEEQRPDALVVAVSWDQTEGIIQEVISYGLPCLVEKPIALSCDALKKIIDNSGVFHDRVMVGYNRRFYDFIPVLKQELKTEELVSVELNFPEHIEHLMRKESHKIANHILLYMSSHWLDLLMFLIGELRVEWMKRRLNKQFGYVEAYNGILRSVKYDVPVHLQANFNAPSNTSIAFHFRESIYRLCPIETLTIFRGMDVIEPKANLEIRRYVPRVENVFHTDMTYKPGFLNQMEYFIDVCVRKERSNRRGCTLQDALAVTQICEAIDNVNEDR